MRLLRYSLVANMQSAAEEETLDTAVAMSTWLPLLLPMLLLMLW